ncbi:MAG: hypothetical protein KZQ58_00340 [gamma proteobacterium symbiont of Bathyaustriella thionipta]|nr:hypothetical protein [gamma proteobacterium symbiont of Bathyaustriella thionipta]
MNYAGLAEIDPPATGSGKLADGRLLESRPDDTHHAAAMACIDCHTERGLMGIATKNPPLKQKQAVDIRCEDCHNISQTIPVAQWPSDYRALLKRIPYRVNKHSRIAVTRNGTPLWNIELQNDKAWLHRKLAGGRLLIPPYKAAHHPQAQQHDKLSCSACHSQWAPQCYGCHLSYDAEAGQFDHVEQKITAGRWLSQRSNIRNTLPPLGVESDGRIVPVVPGMIMSVSHPDWHESLFERRFVRMEAHTSGPSRSCVSCHRSSVALGLGEGRLQWQSDGHLQFQASQPLLRDNLAADAWTNLQATKALYGADSLRPFSRQEIERVLGVTLQKSAPENTLGKP